MGNFSFSFRQYILLVSKVSNVCRGLAVGSALLFFFSTPPFMPSLPLPRRVAALEEYYLSRPVREQQARLAAIGPERLVDDPDITVQVLSGSGPSSYPPAEGPAFAPAPGRYRTPTSCQGCKPAVTLRLRRTCSRLNKAMG